VKLLLGDEPAAGLDYYPQQVEIDGLTLGIALRRAPHGGASS
jgi:hypothetical protein